jgi:CSLREA domain-containing protein
MTRRKLALSSRTLSLVVPLLLAVGGDLATARAADPPRQGAPVARSASPPDPNRTRQGGDTCATALVIPSLPYTDSGTTVGSVNDYDEVCPFTGSTAPDVVYSFTPLSNVNVDITLCTGATDYDTKLYVYQNACPGAVVGCNDDACSSPLYSNYVSQLTDLPLTGGQAYFIVVDGYGGESGNYTVEVSASAVQPADIWVNSPLDVIADDGLCTLREAITAANTNTASGLTPGECPAGSADDVIGLPADTYTLTIPSTDEDNNLDGDLDIRSPITIVGVDPATTVVQAGPTPGSGISGVFHVVNLPGSALTLERVTVRHGLATVFNGGGVYNEGTTNLRDCVVTLNQAGFGGGVRNSWSGATLNVQGSTIAFNTASGNGGGIENQQGLVNIANSTLSGNTAGWGGAIHTVNSSTVNISSCTIANNSGAPGGVNNPNATVLLRNTIMTGNAGGDCAGAGAFGGDNNLLDTGCGGAGNLGAVTRRSTAARSRACSPPPAGCGRGSTRRPPPCSSRRCPPRRWAAGRCGRTCPRPRPPRPRRSPGGSN